MHMQFRWMFFQAFHPYFSISTDELLGLDAPELLSLSGLTEDQKKTLVKLRDEFLAPSQQGNDLSPQQMEILHDVIKAFG